MTPSFPDNEHDFDTLRLRIQKTVSFIQSVPADMLADSAGRSIELNFEWQAASWMAWPMFTTFMLPNFFFHVTTAHDILRHKAVDVGKRDFMGLFEKP